LKKKFSLRIELIIFLLIFVLSILGLIYFFQTTFLDSFYKDSKINVLENIASEVKLSIENDDLDDYMDQIIISNEVCVRVVSNNSKYNNVGACSLKNLDFNTINDIAKQTSDNGGDKLFDLFRYHVNSESELDVYIYSKLFDINDETVMVLVSTMITPIGATISTIKSQYVIIVGIVAIMTIILALILSHFIIKPIKKINDESKNLAKGEYDKSKVKFKIKEFDELNNTLDKANEDISKADKAKKELLANVSHDLRTPLTMIVGYGEMIRDLPEENNESNINVIIDEAKRLSTLVDDLLDISRIENDNIKLNKKEVNLNDLLTNTYHQYEKYCEAQNVKFELKLSEDKIVSIDEARIKQVLYNFINNALNYNDKDNQLIILGSEIIDNKTRVYVYDNGEGISDKDINNIWDRYYKVDKLHKRSHIGSGIGLALSKQLLEAHNIKYGVESKVGEYTKFYFDL
jgi:signal transduction histidine kinase